MLLGDYDNRQLIENICKNAILVKLFRSSLGSLNIHAAFNRQDIKLFTSIYDNDGLCNYIIGINKHKGKIGGWYFYEFFSNFDDSIEDITLKYKILFACIMAWGVPPSPPYHC